MAQEPGARPDLMEEVRVRLPLPLVIPLGALVVIAALAIGFSRILLAVPKDAAVAIALVMSINVLGACAFVALRPTEARRAWPELLVVVLYPVLIGIVIAETGIGEEEASAEAASATSEGEQPAAGGVTTEVTAADVKFSTDQITLKADEETALDFTNEDSVQHNISIYVEEGGKDLFSGEIISAATVTYQIPPLDKGRYYFQCDVHPDSMFGDVVVEG